MSVAADALTGIEVPDTLAAVEPPECRLGSRDRVRLLVASPGSIDHRVFTDLPRVLRRGDLVVVNDSATLPAAVDGRLADGTPVTVHFSTALDDGTWAVEVRPAVAAHGPVWSLAVGDSVTISGGASGRLLSAYPDPRALQSRQWRARVSPGDVRALMQAHGRPIRYPYVEREWPLSDYQTMFAASPGSAEMPSAGRPFTPRVVDALHARGIDMATVTLHTGVSSAESGEPPSPERFRVPARTAWLVNRARRNGGRVIATGTTVTRALESVADAAGRIRAGRGWTDLELGPAREARVVDGLITGWHLPGSSHLRLLTAVAGADVVSAAYEQAVRAGYRWHEFGDSALLLPKR